MVSDWQGGDISKLFPALSGKEDLSMGEDKKADKKRKRIVPKAPVQMIISREYVGTQTVTEAFVPIISEDIRKKIAEGDTFDNEGLECEHCDTEIHPHGLCEKAGMAHSKNVCGRWLFWYKFPKTKFPEYDKRH